MRLTPQRERERERERERCNGIYKVVARVTYKVFFPFFYI